MKRGKNPVDPFIYPTRSEIEGFHAVIIQQRGERGYAASKGMIDACVEYARTDTHGLVPFPTVIQRASAMMYAFITFHPFADGNKRTSLLVVSYFFFGNGYRFGIAEDAPEFTKGVATRCLDNVNHETIVEINRIASWLRPHLSQGILRRIFYYLTRNRNTSLLSFAIWTLAFGIWSGNIFPHMNRLRREAETPNESKHPLRIKQNSSTES